MSAKTAALLAAGLALSLLACQGDADNQSATPAPTATVVHIVEEPSPAPSSSGAARVEVTPKSTACGAEKLSDYLNLLPTSTAKEEIVKTLGHDRVRYVSLQEAKASESPDSTRVTAGLGVDGRIKQFACG